MKRVGIVIVTILFFLGCVSDRFYLITIKNEADYNIRYFVALPGAEHIYPDTSLTTQLAGTLLKTNAEGYFGDSKQWESIFKQLPGDTLSIYFFHTDTLATYPWEQVRAEYKVLNRYDLSLQDLIELEFVVPYPPTLAVKNMAVYPASE